MQLNLIRTLIVFILLAFSLSATAEPKKIVAFGDSLSAGYGLPVEDGFTSKLEKAITARGYNVLIINAGVSGDTSSGGRARLDWSLAADTDAVILELGANDMLRGVPPQKVRENLDAMMRALKERKLPVLIAGMRAAPNLGKEYGAEFNSIYPDLSKKYDALLYPFFLDGVAGSAKLNQSDGLHPSTQGVDVIVERILPSVVALIKQIDD